jgi:hypothetical protein
MIFKVIVGIFAAALLLTYVAPVVLRLKEMPLWIICLLGVGMMLLDLWQSLRAKDD